MGYFLNRARAFMQSLEVTREQRAPEDRLARLDCEISGKSEISPATPPEPSIAILQAQAEAVASRSEELLARQGYVLWQCSALGGDTIAIVEQEGDRHLAPADVVAYTRQELRELAQCSPNVQRLAYEARKLGCIRGPLTQPAGSGRLLGIS